MTIEIELPKIVEERLRAELGDLRVAGKEAMLVELYRQGRSPMANSRRAWVCRGMRPTAC